MTPEFIYTMKDLRKVVPPKREILKGIWLSFYHGAKIGVLGLNGAGKSTLLRIMAGVDQEFIGEAFLGKGYTVGFLPQEPMLDPAKTVLGNVAGWILELDRGAGIPWEGNYSSWLEQKRTRLQQEEKSESARQKTLERELEWVRMAPRARQAKSKARLQAYEKMLAEEGRETIENVEIYIPPGPRLGNVVIEAQHLRKGYGENLLIEGLSFKLPPAGIVGVIGPNG